MNLWIGLAIVTAVFFAGAVKTYYQWRQSPRFWMLLLLFFAAHSITFSLLLLKLGGLGFWYFLVIPEFVVVAVVFTIAGYTPSRNRTLGR
jgi:hypothetical protein